MVSYVTARHSRDLVVAAHKQVTVESWEKALPLVDPFVSPMTVEEASRGDAAAATERLSRIAAFPVLEVTDQVRDLADRYFERIQIPEKARGDAYHLATATYHGMDFLVSWNFAHILSARVHSALYEVNALLSIATPIICTPEQLLEV